MIEMHWKKRSEESESSYSIDHCFLDEVMNEIENDIGKKQIFEKHLLQTVVQLFRAGTTSTSVTLQWIVWALVMYPEIQLRGQKEIDQVLGAERCFSIEEHKNKIPYVEALILEALRYGSAIPLSIQRKVTSDIQIDQNGNSFVIPEGTFVYTNIYSIHHDPKVWTDPDTFRPDRFLSDDGRNIDQNMADRLLPFGAGKRKCPAAGFANLRLFIFVCELLRNLQFRKPGSEKDPTIGREFSFSSQCKPFNVIVKMRR